MLPIAILLRAGALAFRYGRPILNFARASLPAIRKYGWEGVKAAADGYSFYHLGKEALGISDDDNDLNQKENSTSLGGIKKNVTKYFNYDSNSIAYDDAKVFVFTNIPEHMNVIKNYDKRGTMYSLYVSLISRILNKDEVSGLDVIAFKNVNDLRRSKLIPKNELFFKILKKNGSFYIFNGNYFHFIYIVGSSYNVFKIINSFFTNHIPELRNKMNQNTKTENSSVSFIKSALGVTQNTSNNRNNNGNQKNNYDFVRFPTI